MNEIRIKSQESVEFPSSLMERIQELIGRYPQGKEKSALIPILHAVQDHHQHSLTTPLMDKVATLLNIKPIEVYEVATFYSMFNLKPVGQYVLEFCRTSCCAIVGGEDLMDYTCNKLGIKEGETTPDGLFTIKGVECLGACGYAPMLQLGDFYHEHLTPNKIDDLIAQCKNNAVELLAK
jgi:NADH-quinone oxidoreductase subunit E